VTPGSNVAGSLVTWVRRHTAPIGRQLTDVSRNLSDVCELQASCLDAVNPPEVGADFEFRSGSGQL
jgi:hypothetical protein